MQLQRQLRVVDPVVDEGTSLKVAFATTDMKQVNQHFGSAKAFAVYAVNPEQSTLLEVLQFGQLEQDGNEDKLAVKLRALEGCAIVYSQAVGASAVQQLMRINVQPVRVEPGARVSELIGALQQDMKNGPSAWLAKAIAAHSKPDMGRFDAMEDEGWQED